MCGGTDSRMAGSSDGKKPPVPSDTDATFF